MRHAKLAVLVLVVSIGSGAAALPARWAADRDVWSSCGQSWRQAPHSVDDEQLPWQKPCEGCFSVSWAAWFTPISPLQRPWRRRPSPKAYMGFLKAMRPSIRTHSDLEDGGSQTAPSLSNGPTQWTITEIATPIVVGLGVAVLAAALFFCYRRRQRTPSSTPRRRAEPLSHSRWLSARLHAPGLLFGLLPGTQAVRPQNNRDPSWEIDDIPGHAMQGSTSSTSSAALLWPGGGPSGFHPQLEEEEDEEEEEENRSRAPYDGHARGLSSSSLLRGSPMRPNVNLALPSAAAPRPTFLERLTRFEVGVRKSPSYRAGHVRPKAPDGKFKIDAAPDSPTTFEGAPSAGTGVNKGPASRTLVGSAPGTGNPSTKAASYTAGQSATPETPPKELNEYSVLLISRVPGEDFSIENSTVEGTVLNH